jgi:hypothetical protein
MKHDKFGVEKRAAVLICMMDELKPAHSVEGKSE